MSDVKTRFQSGVTNGALAATLASKRRLRDVSSLDPADDTTIQHLFLLFFVAQDTSRLAQLLSTISPAVTWRVEFDEMIAHPLVCRWASSAEQIAFVFGSYLFDSVCDGAIRRWRGMFAFFERVASTGGFVGTVHLNLSDLGIIPGLCFSDNRESFTLIPDMSFIESVGYSRYRQHFNRSKDWQERLDTVFWRGSTTGTPPSARLSDNERAALCLLACRHSDQDFDFGISQIVQFSPEWRDAAVSAGIVKNFVPWHLLDHYKFHIDIDGNTNSWPGLFSKLLSGGLVLKIKSEHAYRQWFYHLLLPWVNFVPIRSDLGDLVETVQYLRAHPSEAKRIAAQGQRLAQDLTYEKVLEFAVETVAGFALREDFRKKLKS